MRKGTAPLTAKKSRLRIMSFSFLDGESANRRIGGIGESVNQRTVRTESRRAQRTNSPICQFTNSPILLRLNFLTGRLTGRVPLDNPPPEFYG